MSLAGEFSPAATENSALHSWIAAGLFVLAAAYLLIFLRFFGNSELVGDEGIVLQGSQRILRGQVLYRDFFSFYTPLSFYWMALLFKLFGSSVAVARASLVLFGGLNTALTYQIARRIVSPGLALFAAFGVLSSSLPYYFHVLHNWDSTLFAVLACYCSLRFLERGEARWAFATSSLVAITCLFNQSKGAGLFVGIFICLSLLRVRRSSGAIFLSRNLAWSAAGLAWPFALVLGFFASQAALGAMLRDWVWPLTHYTVANSFALGSLNPTSTAVSSAPPTSLLARVALKFILGPTILIPVFAVLVFFMLAVVALLARHSVEARRWVYGVLILCCCCGLVLSTVATGRRDFEHLNYLGPFIYVAMVWLVDGLGYQFRIVNWLKPVAVFCVSISFILFGLSLLWGPVNARHEFQTRRGTIRTAKPDPMLEAAQSQLAPGEEVLVYPAQPIYYFLTDTFSPLRYDFLQAGMNTASDFDEAARELSANPPRIVLFQSAFRPKISSIWKNTPASVLSVRDPVESYVFAHYRECPGFHFHDYWEFVLLARSDAACPTPPPAAP